MLQSLLTIILSLRNQGKIYRSIFLLVKAMMNNLVWKYH